MTHRITWWVRTGLSAVLFPIVFAIAGEIALMAWANNLDVDYVLIQRGYSTFAVMLILFAVSAGLAGLITGLAAGIRDWWLLVPTLVAGAVNAVLFVAVQPLVNGSMAGSYWLVSWLVSTVSIVLSVLLTPKEHGHASPGHPAGSAGT